MGWLPRRSPRPDPGLPMFQDPAKARRFVRLARNVFAEHGYECVYAEGQLRGVDGWTYGLTNVALMACHIPEREWEGMLRSHVAGLDTAHTSPRERDLDVVGDRIYLRLWTRRTLARPPEACEPVGGPSGSLVGLASIDHPEYVETLTGEQDIHQLGGWSAVRDRALGNLRRLTGEQITTLGEDGEEVHLSVGGFFNASRVLTMAHLLRSDFLVEEPSHGVLFVVPNRHLVGVHKLTGVGVHGAVGTLMRVLEREHDVPGALSIDLWFWRHGAIQRITRPSGRRPSARGSGGFRLVAEGPWLEAMTELGLG